MRSSVFIFCLFSAAMRRWGHDLDQLLAIYMDDIFGIALEKDADAALQRVVDMVLDCGFTAQPNKIVPPASVVEYIGVIVDLERLQYRISPERLRATMELRNWRRRHRASRRDLESIVGKLAWIAQLVPFARLFIHTMRGLARAHHRVRITREMRLDLEWWEAYLPESNGVPILPEALEPFDFDFATDAAGLGFGGHMLDQFAYGVRTDEETARYDINVRELWTVLMAVDISRAQLRRGSASACSSTTRRPSHGSAAGARRATMRRACCVASLWCSRRRASITLLPEYCTSRLTTMCALMPCRAAPSLCSTLSRTALASPPFCRRRRRPRAVRRSKRRRGGGSAGERRQGGGTELGAWHVHGGGGARVDAVTLVPTLPA